MTDSPSSTGTTKALAEFLKWAMQEGPWAGDDLYGADVQERAQSLGLVNEVTYDPDVHGANDYDVAKGEPWLTLTPEVSRILDAAQTSGGAWNDAIEAAAKRAEAEPYDENEHDAITISRCIALGIRALKQPTQGGDKGEAVAWQKRPAFGDYRVWTPCGMEAHDHEFWIDQNYEVRALYAAPQPASNAGGEPTSEQIRSACQWYRHDFGLMTIAEAAVLKSKAREWLRAWQKEGFGASAYPLRAPLDLTSGELNTVATEAFTRAAVIEECAKVADDFAAYEQTIVDRAHADGALSDTGRKNVVLTADSRQVAAEQIAHDIRALSIPSTQSDSAATKHSGTYLGYKDQSGNEMHCANAFCPHQDKCLKGCTCPVAVTSTPRGDAA